jgi:hypothetical protein
MKKNILTISIFFNTLCIYAQEWRFSLQTSYGQMKTFKSNIASKSVLFPTTSTASFVILASDTLISNWRVGINIHVKFFDFLSTNLELGFTEGGSAAYRPRTKITTQGLYLNFQPQLTFYQYFNLSAGLLYEHRFSAKPSNNLIRNTQNLWAYTLNPSVSYKRFSMGYKYIKYLDAIDLNFTFSDPKLLEQFSNDLHNNFWKASNIYLSYTFLILTKK